MPFSPLFKKGGNFKEALQKLCIKMSNSTLLLSNSGIIFSLILDYVTSYHSSDLIILNIILEELFRLLEDNLELASNHLLSLTEEDAERFIKTHIAHELKDSYSTLYMSYSNNKIFIDNTCNCINFTSNISIESGILINISSHNCSNILQSHYSRVSRENRKKSMIEDELLNQQKLEEKERENHILSVIQVASVYPIPGVIKYEVI